MIYFDFKNYSTGHPVSVKHTVFVDENTRNHVNVVNDDFIGLNETITAIYPRFKGFDYDTLKEDMVNDIFGLLILDVVDNIKIFIYHADENEVKPSNQYVHYRPYIVGIYKIKAMNQNEDVQIQELLFENGCGWQFYNDKTVSSSDWRDEWLESINKNTGVCGFIITNGSIGFMDSLSMFNEYDAKLICIDDLVTSLKNEYGE